MVDKYSLLRYYYGYNTFRQGQEEIIDQISSGRDILAVMPTGAGKSICYQIPALMMSGITLVISPLISLMKDQVRALNQNGIRAAYLNSSLTPKQYGMALANVRAGVYKIIYVAPERLMTDGFMELVRAMDISLVAVDEAHCVSQWGHDFRTSYTHICDFVAGLAKRPIVAAFTATATELVKSDIREILKLDSPFEITTGFDRPNLYFGVSEPSSRYDFICNYLDENSGKSGIIYAMTRKSVENIYNKLFSAGYPVTYYHAGLSDRERTDNQDAFIRDIKPIIIATNAFGMGIDKPDVGFIIHYNMPLSMEAYYQEAGRAGRDGSESDCILLYSAADIHTAKFIIENGVESDSEFDITDWQKAKERRYKKLDEMISYCNTTDCLRGYILKYFGEVPQNERCGKCSSCRGEAEVVDVTNIVRAVALAIELTGERYGAVFIADFLHGIDNGRMNSMGYAKERCFGILHNISTSLIRDVISRMIEGGLLIRTEGNYPTLSATPSLGNFIASGRQMTVKIKAANGKKGTSRRAGSSSVGNFAVGKFDNGLYEKLRKFRRETAERRGVPAYVIFTDITMRELAARKPTNLAELMEIRGIGYEKAEKYGGVVIGIIKGYRP